MARGDVTETTELAVLLGYLSELKTRALDHFTKNDASAEESLNVAVDDWLSSEGFRDAKTEE